MYSRHQAPPKSVASIATSPQRQPAKPARSGYEKYQFQDHVSDLQVDPTLWGTGPPAQHPPPQQRSIPAQSRKMLSLEEVEEQMRSQARKASQQPSMGPPPGRAPSQYHQDPYAQAQGYPPVQQPMRPREEYPRQHYPSAAQMPQAELPANVARSSQAVNRSQDPSSIAGTSSRQGPPGTGNLPPDRSMQPQMQPGSQQMRIPGSASFPPGQIITHPQQLMHLSEDERAAFLVEDAKRAKRNHKIFLLSKDNGLMTPQDKNFITRIQLQQLMTATGNVNDQDPDAALAEDFYYQVYNQIRGGPRATPHQPLNHFAQTYLFQTGGRYSGFSRRQAHSGDNHVQRMEQQVQRAVEAAKLKPKNKQLVIEGSLGKISFSNSKTPKPLLNIKRHESGDITNRPHSAGRHPGKEISMSDRKTILKDIENVYSTLMRMEDEQRKEPLLPQGEPEPALIEEHMQWGQRMSELNQKLWQELKVLEPINPGSSVPHPFIAILSYPKGKKAIPRVFRHLTPEQHVTMLTMIVLHLDILDVVRLGHLQSGESQLPTASREAIDLFSAVVIPSLFSYVSEAPLFNVIGLVGLILDRVNVQNVARTRIGLTILTMLTSRATLVKDEGKVDEGELQQWSQNYDRLFDTLEPVLSSIFPGSVNTGEDMYVWQFLAAIGSGASPEQQQRLVIAVK